MLPLLPFFRSLGSVQWLKQAFRASSLPCVGLRFECGVVSFQGLISGLGHLAQASCKGKPAKGLGC